MSNFYAYLHARPSAVDIGGVFYIGKGKGGRAYALKNRNRHHLNVIEKYGRENILIGMLECSSEDIAFALEKGLIRCLRRAGVSLCNQSDGGEGNAGFVPSEDTRALLSLRLKGNRNAAGAVYSAAACAARAERATGAGNPFFGRKHTEESRLRMSAALTGKQSAFKGRKHTPEVLQRLSEMNRGKPSAFKGRKHTEEAILKLRAALSGNMRSSRWVTNGVEEFRGYEDEILTRLSTGDWRYGRTPRVGEKISNTKARKR